VLTVKDIPLSYEFLQGSLTANGDIFKNQNPAVSKRLSILSKCALSELTPLILVVVYLIQSRK
jgi:hypothetical protein